MNTPKISLAIKKKYQGQVAISLAGELLGIGKNGIEALSEAKKKNSKIEQEELLVSRIRYKEVIEA